MCLVCLAFDGCVCNVDFYVVLWVIALDVVVGFGTCCFCCWVLICILFSWLLGCEWWLGFVGDGVVLV